MQSSERLKGVDVFVAVAKAGSFTRAAERLNLTGSAVGKAIARLESRLQVRLFERTTRTLALTDAGTRYLAACSQVLGDLEAAEQALRFDADLPSGRLRIDLPATFGRRIVLPLLLPFFQRYPRVQPVLSFTDRFVDIDDEGIDVAVRIGTPQAWPASLGQRFLGQERKIFCAAPAYLAARGVPDSVEALDAHAAIAYARGDGAVSPWLLQRGNAVIERRIHDAQVVAGNAEAQLELALAGLGIAQLPTWLVDGDLGAGRLLQILPAHATPGLPIHVVWPKAKQTVARVTQLVDALGDALGDALTHALAERLPAAH
ncbi:LysR substrate-binding domain-containing protein [Massilia sp. 9096]|uniref:LysR substrate-binding domain-containing protein n=1 Tax=Massilia sp. 9096 TaxID=1500894 RepID=UPI0006916C08|nr:LysR substrate-binding domain-containing protein [Massilia sp. 9096]